MESALTIIKQNEKKLDIEASIKNKITPKITVSNISELADMSSITDDIVEKNLWLKSLVSQGKMFTLVITSRTREMALMPYSKLHQKLGRALG